MLKYVPFIFLPLTYNPKCLLLMSHSGILFVCGFIFLSSQLITELFQTLSRLSFSHVVLCRRDGDQIYEIRWLFVTVRLNALCIVMPHWDNMSCAPFNNISTISFIRHIYIKASIYIHKFLSLTSSLTIFIYINFIPVAKSLCSRYVQHRYTAVRRCHMSADIQGPAVRHRTKSSHDQVHKRQYYCVHLGFWMGVPGGALLGRTGCPYLLLIVKCDIMMDPVLTK